MKTRYMIVGPEKIDDSGCMMHRGEPQDDYDGCQLARRVVKGLDRKNPADAKYLKEKG